MTDDACLMPVCQHVYFSFIKDMVRKKHVGFILKVLYELPVCVA